MDNPNERVGRADNGSGALTVVAEAPETEQGYANGAANAPCKSSTAAETIPVDAGRVRG